MEDVQTKRSKQFKFSQADNFDFLNWLRGKIESKQTKVLASPTLILSETSDKIIGGKGVEE